MQIGVEITILHEKTFTLGTFFETWLGVCDQPVKKSLGRDEYHLDVAVEPGRRVAATGRTYLCQVDTVPVGLGPVQAPAARPVEVAPASASTSHPIFLHLRTNTFLEPEALTQGLSFRLVGPDNSPLCDFQLSDQRVDIEWLNPGRFLIDLSEIFENLKPGR